MTCRSSHERALCSLADNPADLRQSLEWVQEVCEPRGHKVYAVVNYDGFELGSDLEEAYLDAVQEMGDTYFHGVTRFTTSAFMRAKLGGTLESRGVAPAHLRIRRRSRRRRTHHLATPGVTEVPSAGVTYQPQRPDERDYSWA